MTNFSNFRKQVRYVPRAFALVWAAARIWTSAWLVILVIQSVLPIATVVLTRAFVNSIVGAVKTEWNLEQIQVVLVPFGLLVVVTLVSRILDSIAAWVRAGQSEIVRDYLSSIVQIQASHLDMTYYEQNEYHDLIHRVREQARFRPLTLLESSGLLFQNLLSLIGLAGLLMSYGAGLLPLLIISALPALWSVVRFNSRLNRWRKENTTRERLTFYYDRLLTERMSAPEVRLFGLSNHYRRVYRELRNQLRTERLSLWRGKMIF